MAHSRATVTPSGNRARRLALLYVGLVLYGFAAALMVRANLGLDPWDVFHQGIARHVPLSFGTVIVIVGAAVLLLWIPLRQRPGLGTISNVLVLGPAADLGLVLASPPAALPARIGLLVAGVVLTGIATGMYISAGFGPGPRDGLMTGFAARTGRSLRLVRTAIELSVLALGWLLGGVVGVGTVLFAITIGPLIQLALPVFERLADRQAPAPDVAIDRNDA